MVARLQNEVSTTPPQIIDTTGFSHVELQLQPTRCVAVLRSFELAARATGSLVESNFRARRQFETAQ